MCVYISTHQCQKDHITKYELSTVLKKRKLTAGICKLNFPYNIGIILFAKVVLGPVFLTQVNAVFNSLQFSK